jgi:hypothetical protein
MGRKKGRTIESYEKDQKAWRVTASIGYDWLVYERTLLVESKSTLSGRFRCHH